jgi:hypothetical protein
LPNNGPGSLPLFAAELLQQSCTWEEIKRIMPVLTREDFRGSSALRARKHDAVLERDQCIRARNAERSTPPEIRQIRKKEAKALALMEEFNKNDSRVSASIQTGSPCFCCMPLPT